MGVDLRVVEWLRQQGHDAVHLRVVFAASASELDRGAGVLVEETRHRVRRLPVGEGDA